MSTVTDHEPGTLRPWGDFPAVPYVAMWSDEHQKFRIAKCAFAGMQNAMFTSGTPTGRPVLGKMSLQRQRECMAAKRCQVCRVSLHGQRSFSIDKGGTFTMPGFIVPITALIEPPACERCMRLSVEVCPGIRELRADPKFRVIEVFEYTMIASMIGPAGNGDPLDRFFETYKGKLPVVGYIKAAVTKFKTVDPDTLI